MNLFEKLLSGVFILLILAAIIWGALVGLPSTVPSISMHSEKISEQQYMTEITAEQRQELTEILTKAQSEGSGSRRRPQSEVYKINKPLLDRMGNLNECRRELQNASSEVQEDGSLKIFGIQQGSLLERVGLRENDILRSVNGIMIDFNAIGDCLDAHGNSLDRLTSGNPVVIEIERRGSPIALVIDPPL
jgi:S1-C subfamily serine protease